MIDRERASAQPVGRVRAGRSGRSSGTRGRCRTRRATIARRGDPDVRRRRSADDARRQRHEGVARRRRARRVARAGCPVTRLPATRPTPEPVQSSPKPKCARCRAIASRGRSRLTLTSPVASIVRPKPNSATRSAVERRNAAKPSRRSRQCPRVIALLALQEAAGDAQRAGRAENRNVAAFIQ